MDGIAVARLLLKVASARGIGRPLGAVFRHAGELGAGVAEGFGAQETGQTVGRLVGQGALVGTGYVGAKKGKQQLDEFRYRHGLYSEPTY